MLRNRKAWVFKAILFTSVVILLAVFSGFISVLSNSWPKVFAGDTTMELRKQATSKGAKKVDWFESNITAFHTSSWVFGYVVLRETTVIKHGDFACPNSLRPKSCTHKASSLQQAAELCEGHGDLCKGFVWTREMELVLKHSIRTLGHRPGTVVIMKKSLVPSVI